jgi:maleylacetate reductase
VLSTPEQRASAERIADMLGARAAGVFDRAVMHVPIETAREAREVARKLGADCAVAIGGGSTTGLGKAIALESSCRSSPSRPPTPARDDADLRHHRGRPEEDRQATKVLPRTVIYDPELSLTPAGGHERHQRHQRHRARRRGPVLGRRQSRSWT